MAKLYETKRLEAKQLDANLLETNPFEPNSFEPNHNEYESGDVVAPGVYIDVDTGAVVKINQPDELPEGQRLIHYRRRFRRVGNLAAANN